MLVQIKKKVAFPSSGSREVIYNTGKVLLGILTELWPLDNDPTGLKHGGSSLQTVVGQEV